jgi:hypothetical protein
VHLQPSLFPKYPQLLVHSFILVQLPAPRNVFRQCLLHVGCPNIQTSVHEVDGRWFAILPLGVLLAWFYKPLGEAASFVDQDLVPNSVHVRPLVIGKRVLCGRHIPKQWERRSAWMEERERESLLVADARSPSAARLRGQAGSLSRDRAFDRSFEHSHKPPTGASSTATSSRPKSRSLSKAWARGCIACRDQKRHGLGSNRRKYWCCSPRPGGSFGEAMNEKLGEVYAHPILQL